MIRPAKSEDGRTLLLVSGSSVPTVAVVSVVIKRSRPTLQYLSLAGWGTSPSALEGLHASRLGDRIAIELPASAAQHLAFGVSIQIEIAQLGEKQPLLWTDLEEISCAKAVPEKFAPVPIAPPPSDVPVRAAENMKPQNSLSGSVSCTGTGNSTQLPTVLMSNLKFIVAGAALLLAVMLVVVLTFVLRPGESADPLDCQGAPTDQRCPPGASHAVQTTAAPISTQATQLQVASVPAAPPTTPPVTSSAPSVASPRPMSAEEFYIQGLRDLNRNDFSVAAMSLREAAELGHHKAQYELARLYFGLIPGQTPDENLPMDENKGMMLMRQAAEGGVPQAAAFIGKLHGKR